MSRILGQGSFGQVYLALDTHTLVSCAVKCIRTPEPGSKEEELQGREAELHERVSEHDNIVGLWEVFTDSAHTFVVMDLCAGGTLESLIKNGRFIGDDDFLRASFLQILGGIEFCHANGVYHRDIKPQNILCSRGGMELFIADFGLSTSEPFTTDTRVGSKAYMSPGMFYFALHTFVCFVLTVFAECAGTQVHVPRYSTQKSDVWALGIVLVNMVADDQPWQLAATSDYDFAQYLEDPDHIYRILPVSRGVNAIFNDIFQMSTLR